VLRDVHADNASGSESCVVLRGWNVGGMREVTHASSCSRRESGAADCSTHEGLTDLGSALDQLAPRQACRVGGRRALVSDMSWMVNKVIVMPRCAKSTGQVEAKIHEHSLGLCPSIRYKRIPVER
jgi:hypothetical protein